MKIAYCIHSLRLFGGIERVMTIKANYLADVFGYEVHIITAKQKGEKPHFKLSDKIKLHDIGISEKVFLSVYGRKLDKVLCDIRPDICISVGGNDIYYLPKCTDGSHKIAEFHFSHEKYRIKYGGNFIGDLYAGFRTRRLERIASRLDRFIVLTESDRDDWKKVVPGVVSIYNPLTFKTDEIAPLVARRCIAIGRLEPQKNFRDLIITWSKVAPSHPDWTLDIYGKGHQHDALEALINGMGLAGKVMLKGSSNNIIHELLSSSCLVMTSIYEGFPMVLLEALETGLPMVSYNCPKGPSEIISDNKSGFLVKVGDTDSMAEKIIRLMDDENLRKSFGKEARASSSRFQFDAIMREWKRLFEEIVS